jgi:hypothetical protein
MSYQLRVPLSETVDPNHPIGQRVINLNAET